MHTFTLKLGGGFEMFIEADDIIIHSGGAYDIWTHGHIVFSDKLPPGATKLCESAIRIHHA